MPSDQNALEQVAARLYGLPLEEFTPARDAAVKQARRDGDRGAAERLRKLRKPNLVAWALNQVRRAHPDVVQELLASGERLQEAQRQLVAAGERGLLRQAAAQERELVGRVVELAQRELVAAGHAADATAQSRLFSTLHAAAGSEEVRAALAAGRLVRDHEISDLGLGGAAALLTDSATAADKPAARRATPRSKRRDDDVAAARRAAERQAAAIGRRLERARERQAALQRKAAEAARRQADAERTAAKAAKELDRARAVADTAESAARDAAATVDGLVAELAALGDGHGAAKPQADQR